MSGRRPKPYTARDMAGFCAIGLDQFYATRELRQLRGMPAPYQDRGRLAWDRSKVDCWRKGLTLPAPANDVAPPLAPASDERWRDRLHKVFAAGGA